MNMIIDKTLYTPEVVERLEKVADIFELAYLQDEGYELILQPRWNVYLRVNVSTAEEFDYKILSTLAYFTATHHFAKNTRQSKWAKDRLERWFRRTFSYDDLQVIYQKLGNCCDMPMGLSLIRSGFDMEVLNGNTRG